MGKTQGKVHFSLNSFNFIYGLVSFCVLEARGRNVGLEDTSVQVIRRSKHSGTREDR